MSKEIFKNVTNKFLRYVKIDTESDPRNENTPSTKKQFDLANLLVKELKELNVDVELDEDYGYVYARIPSNIDDKDDSRNKKTIAFIAHMDTSPAVTGKNVNPQIVKNYQGDVIELGEGLKLDPKEFSSLNKFIGDDLITTDGTTLLGADDKAGVAEIMTMVEYLVKNEDIKHGNIAICFTPDEEIGRGVDKIDLDKLNADYAYTVDGGILGELEYENFNAASAKIIINGKSVHPGSAKNVMVNSVELAVEFANLLPKDETPATTENYEGFYLLEGISGSVDQTNLSYIIRDHNMDKFKERKNFIKDLVKKFNDKYGENTFELDLTDTYYNMKEKIEPHMFLINKAKSIMEDVDITPIIIPIRGGTDGARLSYMGLPTPNICAGGMNFHGKYEYISIQSMEKISELITNIAINIFK